MKHASGPESANRRGTPRSRGDAPEGQGPLRDWIQSLGPSAVVSFLTHDEYEREQRRTRTAPASPPVFLDPDR